MWCAYVQSYMGFELFTLRLYEAWLNILLSKNHDVVKSVFMLGQLSGNLRRAFTLARTLQMQGFALPASSPGRRFLRLTSFFPSFSRSGFAEEPSRSTSLFICAAACGVALASSARCRAVVSARRKPELRRHIPRRNFHEHNNTGCIRWHLAQIQLRQHFRKVVRLDRFDGKEDFLESWYALHSNEHDPQLMFQDWEGIPACWTRFHSCFVVTLILKPTRVTCSAAVWCLSTVMCSTTD